MPAFTALFLGLASLAAAAPTVQEGTVLRPHFTTQEGSHSAGTAFAVEINDRVLVVTALHLFGPAGGLKSQVDGAKIAEFTTSVALRDAFTGGDFGQAKKTLLLSNTQPMGDTAAGDIVAFEAEILTGLDKLNAKSKDLVPLSLAEKVPAKGDNVYVAALVGEDKDSRVHKATVVESNDKWLFYEYADNTLDIAGTNGAAVLDENGQVIGMNLGGGKMDDGKLIGSANPLNPIRQRLTEAVTRE
jgi:hypothetical protein